TDAARERRRTEYDADMWSDGSITTRPGVDARLQCRPRHVPPSGAFMLRRAFPWLSVSLLSVAGTSALLVGAPPSREPAAAPAAVAQAAAAEPRVAALKAAAVDGVERRAALVQQIVDS